MTDRDDITRQIEERLGRDASEEMATRMFQLLRASGGIGFDAHFGYELNPDPEDALWNRCLAEVIGL